MDMISMLPDEILCYILSFLRTHEAVATCLVSKRWRNLWISVPALDFNHYEFCHPTRQSHPYFNHFVNIAIHARDSRQPITRFKLLYEPILIGSALLNNWVNTAMKLRVENLDICIAPFSHDIDLNVCSCITLVVLKLEGFGLRVGVSSRVELPSLKSLHLANVCFPGFQSFLELICGCPLLEDLKAINVRYGYIGKSFDQEFKSLPKLLSAVINDPEFTFPLKIISNAKFLSIEEGTFGTVFDKVVPEFPNLVHVVFTSLGSSSWKFVFEILKNCPKLQDFELVLSCHANRMTLLPYPEFIPECLTSHFRKCTLKNYKGTRCERLFAQYIMQHSTSLRTMKICSCSKCSTSTETKHKDELALCPRKSALCELSFK